MDNHVLRIQDQILQLREKLIIELFVGTFNFSAQYKLLFKNNFRSTYYVLSTIQVQRGFRINEMESLPPRALTNAWTQMQGQIHHLEPIDPN